MTRILALCVLLASLSCGGDDDLTPVETCNQLYTTFCQKIFNCFSKAELDAAR